MSETSSPPLNPPTAYGDLDGDLPAYVANGLIGLRVRPMALRTGMALVCGYSGEHPVRRIEAAANAPYPLAADLCLGGVWLSDANAAASALRQDYDFGSGELTSRFRVDLGGRQADVEVLTFCSRHDPTLACQEVAVTPSQGGEVGLRATIDARGADGRLARARRETAGEVNPAVDGILLWQSDGGLSTCGLAGIASVEGGAFGDPTRPAFQYGQYHTEFRGRARAGRTVRLRQIVSLVPDVMHANPDQHAARLAAKAADTGFDALRAANRAVWDELWKGRIRLLGASESWQGLADAAVFYLNCSAHRASPASTSIFGLATWHDYHYYYGHVMWDIEAFAVPPLCLLQPDAARSLLDYRSRCLDGARTNARLFGRRGLQFPWESAPRSGEESAPVPGTAAWHEDHVSLDVAHAFALHAWLTADAEFLRSQAWPVLSGVADWIVSRVTRTARGYEIGDSMGIAERQAPVHNAAFTNMAAVVVLRHAINAADQLGRAPDPIWSEIAEQMCLPRRGPAVVSHDDYRRDEEKGGTPDPLMGIFPFGYPLSPEQETATLNFYLGQAESYIGSPMLSALYGAWAARLGDRRQAARRLDQGYGGFVQGRFLQTLEYRTDRFPEQPRAGPFFANIGGFLTGLLFGFTGLRPSPGKPSDWIERDSCLPSGWRGIEVERLWLGGEPVSLSARQGRRPTLTPLAGLSQKA
jgi:trehalose/maltose hydrolase-like predicted phosphorylase